jgi:hypothetical protein
MSTKPMKQIKNPKAQVQVDLRDAETIKCEDCGNSVFIPAFFIKRLSPIVSPTGQEALIPIQVYSCGNCGKVPDKFKQDGED